MAIQRLQSAGIPTIEDEIAGAERYISLRAEWDPYVSKLSHYGGYDCEEVDPMGYHAESIRQKR